MCAPLTNRKAGSLWTLPILSPLAWCSLGLLNPIHSIQHPWQHRVRGASSSRARTQLSIQTLGTRNNRLEFLWVFRIGGHPKKYSKVIPETKKERPSNGTPLKPTGSCLSHTLQTISLKIPLLININVIHKSEASVKKNGIMDVFIIWTSDFQLNLKYLSFLSKAKWHGFQPFQSLTV